MTPNLVAHSQLTKTDSINIDKVVATKKLYREIRCLTKEIEKFNSRSNVFTTDTIKERELKKQINSLQEKIKQIESQRENPDEIIKEVVNPIKFFHWIITFLVFIIGLLLGYLLSKKKVQRKLKKKFTIK